VPTRTGYAASKHAMQGFFDSLRIELADDGVSVTVVCPGFVATGAPAARVRPRRAAARDEPRARGRGDDGRRVRAPHAGRGGAARARAGDDGPGRVGQWLRLVSPALVDRIARRAVEQGR
jgi:NAD(P)-dependent dehydrogenase (short-subunit alcohol dehydrogenase family)